MKKYNIRGDNFKFIVYEKFGKYTLQECIIKYNLLSYGFIYKGSNRFKLVTYEELLEEKYCAYLFCDAYYEKHFEYTRKLWLRYMPKPLPNIKHLKKIVIR